ncbi:MAG TPA: ABC transporter permease [Panacibacter sp.]|nr:ABC transporter permease [Panacibacter sp.]
MFKNHLAVALRNLGRRKGFTAFNILGLTIGIACCLLLFQYVSYENSYDNYAAGKPLYRMRLDTYQDGKLAWQSATSYPITGPYLKKDFPEVEDYCRLKDAEMLLSYEAKEVKFFETKGYFADASALTMLNIQLIKGNAANALSGPDKIILSEDMARKYFGAEDALGKILTFRDANKLQRFEVTGVFKNYAPNSHLMLQYLVSYATLGKQLRMDGDTTDASEKQWGWYDFYTYIQLKPGTDYTSFEKKLPAFCYRYWPDHEWAKLNNAKDALYLIPVKDIHLGSNFNQEAEVNGNGRSVQFLFYIALFILVIAWVNNINIATARSMERAKEVGVRKVMGANRSSLIGQFLLESLIINMASLLLAFVIALALTPWFNAFTGNSSAGWLFGMSAKYWIIFCAIFITGTILSGLYPAFVLSAYQPVKVLKGIFKNSSGGLVLRKILIIFQFVTSIILIASTFIVYRQVQYMREQELGFNMNQTLVLSGAISVNDSTYQNVFQPFRSAVMQVPGVQNITASSAVMGKEIYWTNDVRRTGTAEQNEKTFTVFHLGIDYDFNPAYKMKLLAGRNFSKDYGTDGRACMINEAGLHLLGYKNAAEALHTKLLEGNADTLTVTGVLADYHQLGLQKSIDPQIILLRPDTRNFYSLKIAAADMPKTIEAIEKIWTSFFPNDPYNYFFLDDYYNTQYKASMLFGSVFGIFAVLAIIIACFGLSGLSAYNIIQRTKEIGMRKVLGASVRQLLFLLSKDFMLLVLLAFIIATPLCWFMMSNWLNDYAFRATISIWIFFTAGLLAFIIAFVTISVQVLKAALANPVKSLRAE